MTERGMIFNAEMVRAILDGRKTQTRRPVKFPVIDKNMGCELAGNELARELAAGNYWNSPFGKPGDRIWVRETWAEAGAGAPELLLYRANYPKHVPSHYENVPPAEEIRWAPSIHMPRWASRILLEITDVRVERLNSISEEDAGNEGYPADPSPFGGHMDKWLWFRQLWDGIYPEQSFKHNPWVWVIEFKRIEGGGHETD
ncbi:morphogenetic protein [Leclercia adecarboxylata]|uniref:morphogenetic protein n=1 Tax=Leclercia adecarboxylata TaxID=83655 RepID=UPI0009E317A6|nr:morphogenetic protein [Leclercia adecarboxylata]